MSVRLTPHILSVADWRNPLEDPIRRQFIPLQSTIKEDHPALELDSLHETDDSPVPGLVHRYSDKVLFLGKHEETVATTSANSMKRHQFARSTVVSVRDHTPWGIIQNPW